MFAFYTEDFLASYKCSIFSNKSGNDVVKLHTQADGKRCLLAFNRLTTVGQKCPRLTTSDSFSHRLLVP
jgi:hypothetical protein